MKQPDPAVADWIGSLGAIPAPPEKLAAVQGELRRLKLQIHQHAVLRELETIAQLAGEPVSPQAYLDLIVRLRAARLVRSSSAVASLTLQHLAALPADQVLPVLPSAKVIDAYMKAADVSEAAVKEKLLSAVRTASEAGIEWLLGRAAPDELWPLFGQLLSVCRAGGRDRDAAERTLQRYLVRDPKGERLASLVAFVGTVPDLLAPLAQCIRTSDEAVAAVVENLGALACDSRCVAAIGDFLRILFMDLGSEPGSRSSGSRRRTLCARLARIGTALLLAPPEAPAAAQGLEVVRELSEHLRNHTRDPESRALTWVLAPLGEETSEKTVYLTPDGARRWALALEDAQRAGESVERLEMLGYNLGMRPLLEPGQEATYAPSAHEDVEGGLLPGARVVAVTSGWSFAGRPLIRAKVRLRG